VEIPYLIFVDEWGAGGYFLRFSLVGNMQKMQDLLILN